MYRCLLLLLFLPVPLAAQTVTIQGVYVDSEAVLRSRTLRPELAKFRPDRRQPDEQVFLSLPKLFAEVQRKTQNGEPLTDAEQYLGGMVKLTHVTLDKENRDLLIAGDAEELDTTDPLRPRGKRTGRPALQLHDLVLALRHLGPGSRNRVFGCTLLNDPQAAQRVVDLQSRLGPLTPAQQPQLAQALREAIGPLEAKYFGIPADTRFALTCIEADYLMKRLSLGLDHAPGLKSYLDRSTGTGLYHRFWFTAAYDPLAVSPDGTVYAIPGPGLKVLASDSPQLQETQHPAANAFAADLTQKLPQLETLVPVFGDLHNLADVSILAALIAEDHLATQIQWDLTWILDADNYALPTVTTPKQAETLVNFQTKGRRTVTVSGGVQVDLLPLLKNRQRSEIALNPPAMRGQWSVTVPKAK